MMTPCFYCDKESKYTCAVDKIKDKYATVDVCEDHFIYNEAS